VVWGGYTERVRIGLDYFDASINRVAAWIIGARNMLKALLLALLAPTAQLKQLELAGDYTSRLALMEDIRMLPAGAVWDYYCSSNDVPAGTDWLAEVKKHERTVLAKRM
jgi:L-rhamnose isomerase